MKNTDNSILKIVVSKLFSSSNKFNTNKNSFEAGVVCSNLNWRCKIMLWSKYKYSKAKYCPINRNTTICKDNLRRNDYFSGTTSRREVGRVT